MSAEALFQAALAARAELVALVGTRIALHSVEQGTPLPLVVFSASHQPELSLAGQALGMQTVFTAEAWSDLAEPAAAVADEIEAAIADFNASQTSVVATVTARAGAFDGELKLNGEVLTVEWWAL